MTNHPIAIITLALAAAAAAAPARAQAPRPPCCPLINGYPASLPHIAVGAVGRHIYWACSSSKSAAPLWYGFSCIEAECNTTLAREAAARVTRASAKVGTANAEWDKAVTYTCAAVVAEQTPRGVLCRERQALLNNNAAGWLK